MSTASGSKRKASGAPISVTAGIMSTEQAGQQGGAPSTAKRTRVDGQSLEDEDTAGDLDIEEQDRKRMQQGRRGRVVTEGYDSEDSEESGDEEDVAADEGEGGKQNGKVAGVDEDDDMFNLDGVEQTEGDDENGKTKGKQKAGKKYLEMKDIEGQEFSEQGSEEEREAELELESDDEGEGEEQGGEQAEGQLHDPDAVVKPLRKVKNKAKPGDMNDMGFQMDSFNMKNEMAAGRFDEEGNYIPNAKDPHAEHDKWLAGHYSKKGIKAAKQAKERREKEARERERRRENAHLDEDECKMRLTGLLRRGETVLEALQRLGTEAKKAQTKKGSSATDTSSHEDLAGGKAEPADQHARQSKANLDQITSLTSELMSRHGRVNIYDETYEALVRQVRKSGLVRSTWDPAAAAEQVNGSTGTDCNLTYEYRWSPSYLAAMSQAQIEHDGDASATAQSQADQIFGPFSADELKAWMESGYFGNAGERIVLRPSVEQDNSWKSWDDVFG